MTDLPFKPSKCDKRSADERIAQETMHPYRVLGSYFSKWIEVWKEAASVLEQPRTQDRLAELLGYDRTFISKIKSGIRKPSLGVTGLMIAEFYEAHRTLYGDEKVGVKWPAEEVREVLASIGYSWEDVYKAIEQISPKEELLTWWKSAAPKKPQTHWPILPSKRKLVRREVHEELKEMLVKRVYGWYAAYPFVLLYGVPRVGKTILAIQITRETQKTFSDGIVWLSVGENMFGGASAEQLAEDACRQVGLKLERERATWMETWLEWFCLFTRRCCLVLDGVNDKNINIVPQLISGMNSRCVVLITTSAPLHIRPALEQIHLDETMYERKIRELRLKGFSSLEAIEYSKKLYPSIPIPESSLTNFVRRVSGFPEAIRLFLSECTAQGVSSPKAIEPVVQKFAVIFDKNWEEAALNLWRSLSLTTQTIFQQFLMGLDLHAPYPRAVSPLWAALVWECDQTKAEILLQHLEELGLIEHVEVPYSPFITHKVLYRVTFPFWQIRHLLVPTGESKPHTHLLRRQRKLKCYKLMDSFKRFFLACQTFPPLFIWLVFKLLRKKRLTRRFYLLWGSAPFAEALYAERFMKMPIAIEDEWQMYTYYQQIRHTVAWFLLFSLSVLYVMLLAHKFVPDGLILFWFTFHLFLLFFASWVFAWYRWAVQKAGIRVK